MRHGLSFFNLIARLVFSFSLSIALGASLNTALDTAIGTEAHAADVLRMVSGQQKVISASGVSRIAIANPNVADVKVVSAGQVLVTAIAAGQTELTIWRGSRTTTYTVVVTTMDPRQLQKEVRKLLGDREGVRVKIIRDAVYIEGKVLTLNDLEKVEEVCRLFPMVRNMVKLDPSAHNQIAAAINRQLSRAGLKNAQASVVGATIFLEGMVDSEADIKKAEIITRAIGQNIQSVLKIGSSRMIELDVEFVEISKSSLDRIGIKWPTDITGQVGVTYNQVTMLQGDRPDSGSFSLNASLNASFGLALQFNDGNTRLLARPRLVAASGQRAKFLVGGEMPIPIVTDERVNVEFKEYGIRLDITPIATAGGAINAKIMAEISDIDHSVAVMGIPGFLTRRVDTEVTVKDGETIVLSGLVQFSEGKDITRVPFLGHIPILGELFKSREFRERRTELVIFVTPRLVDPLSKHLRELSSTVLKNYREARDDVRMGLLD
ncbi:pilus assembly protein N-terminal domain-containing protein [Myxococcota bacterium]|nr:pilus assembly protein N-terminal domain-containing protein [Myxococcota bacterium]